MLRSIADIIEEARASLRCLDAVTATLEAAQGQGLLIDVREAGEVENNPAPNSVNIPRSILEIIAPKKIPDADTPVYLHCASGVRATLAAEQLLRLGYTQVTIITCSLDQVRAAHAGESAD